MPLSYSEVTRHSEQTYTSGRKAKCLALCRALCAECQTHDNLSRSADILNVLGLSSHLGYSRAFALCVLAVSLRAHLW